MPHTPAYGLTRSHEHEIQHPTPGVLMLLVGIILLPFFGLGLLLLLGLALVNPNQSKVILLFGNYKGTIRRPGLWWVNPFCQKRAVSLRVHNFNSETLKVNDLRGNPVDIAAVVVWRVKDTAQAAFDVENYESYVAVQSESAIRTTASSPRSRSCAWTCRLT
ncbi:MAG: SPFH domain-containing protein [Planctomycetota bacterium]|nr:SPFH domain-containing protein [Planctomycetota bacterium]